MYDSAFQMLSELRDADRGSGARDEMQAESHGGAQGGSQGGAQVGAGEMEGSATSSGRKRKASSDCPTTRSSSRRARGQR